MAFEIVTLNHSTYHLQSGANMGVISDGNRAVVVDTGLDDDSGRRIKKALEQIGVRLEAVILTHGHADHFGGTAYLRRSLPPFRVNAPPLEAAFITHPTLEGIMLSAGALPFDHLKGKFTLAPACKVDEELTPGLTSIAGFEVELIPLPGHSPNQMGVRWGDVLFCADAFLPPATLTKYPVPFTVHLGQALESLAKLESLQDLILAPGHGPHLPDPREVIQINRDALWRVIETTNTVLAEGSAEEGAITQAVCQRLGDPLANPAGYYLARTTVQAALVYLYEQGRAQIIAGGRLQWAHT